MDKALETMINNMPEKTGKSLQQWKDILAKENFSKHMQAVNYLKKIHSVTHGFANTIVSLSKENSDSAEDLVTQQYTKKEPLIPIYDKLIEAIKNLGSDVIITPKKTTVSCIRKKQFCLIKPATKTRIDLGLKFKNKETTDRLQNSGPFGTMCTHRIQITAINDVNKELIKWLQEAYNNAN
jgi:predicted transport protein